MIGVLFIFFYLFLGLYIIGLEIEILLFECFLYFLKCIFIIKKFSWVLEVVNFGIRYNLLFL